MNRNYLFLVFLLVLSTQLSYANNNTGQLLFQQKCASCHSVSGQGRRIAPDLKFAARMGDIKLRKNIVRMQSNTGPLSSSQISDIMSYLNTLSSNDNSNSINQSNQTSQPQFPQGMPGNLNLSGASLYAGTKPFTNGGPACISCHTINGYGSGPPLFKVARHASKCMYSDFLLYPRNRAMANAYGNSPLTRTEAVAIGQYLQSINSGEGGMMRRFGGSDDGSNWRKRDSDDD